MLQRFAILLCASVFTVACSQSDAGITTKVKSKLAADDTVEANDINVTTRDRVVTLSGAVETTAAKDQAIQIARQTEGVSDVVDQLTVKETAPTTGLPDRDVSDSAREAGRDVADSAREAGRDVADSARGAANATGDRMSDASITAAVKSKLLADTMVSGLKIDVDTKDGVVTLTGPVKNQAEANQAQKLAQSTDGVHRVVSNMKVGH